LIATTTDVRLIGSYKPGNDFRLGNVATTSLTRVLTVPAVQRMHFCGFVQRPIYSKLNGQQVLPR
jgi:hypothetical protein